MTGTKIKIVLIVTIWALFFSVPVWAGERFTDNGDGTVTDHQLGVMWAKTDNQGNINTRFRTPLKQSMTTGASRLWRNSKAFMYRKKNQKDTKPTAVSGLRSYRR